MNKYKNKSILITGGLGMIGSSIADRLVDLGADITIADSCLEPYGANEHNIKDIKDKVKFYKIDIRDKKKMIPLIEKTEIIFNLAGQVSHNDSLKNPFLDADINYIGHLNVLEIVRKVNPHIKVLYSGSRLQFGKVDKNPVSENHPMRPLTPYALNKTAAENLYLFYKRIYGIPVVIFRISNPYGPRGQIKHSKYCIINWFIRQAMEGKTINIFGDGEQIRDYIYIDDLVEAFILTASNDVMNGSVYNVGIGRGVKFKDMVKIIVDTVGSGKIKYVKWPLDYINVETGDYIADIDKINKSLDWKPKIDLRTGIRKTFDYLINYNKYYL